MPPPRFQSLREWLSQYGGPLYRPTGFELSGFRDANMGRTFVTLFFPNVEDGAVGLWFVITDAPESDHHGKVLYWLLRETPPGASTESVTYRIERTKTKITIDGRDVIVDRFQCGGHWHAALPYLDRRIELWSTGVDFESVQLVSATADEIADLELD